MMVSNVYAYFKTDQTMYLKYVFLLYLNKIKKKKRKMVAFTKTINMHLLLEIYPIEGRCSGEYL